MKLDETQDLQLRNVIYNIREQLSDLDKMRKNTSQADETPVILHTLVTYVDFLYEVLKIKKPDIHLMLDIKLSD